MSSTLQEGNWKVALTESAQTYLQALDKKRKIAAARGGASAEAAIVNEQKKQANYLAGDDDKMRVAAANKLRRPTSSAKPAFEQQSRNRNAFEQQSRSTTRNPVLDGKKSGFPK